MAIQEFDLGVKDSGSIYPLMEQFMASMNKNAEEIGNNIRANMLRTEANNQAKDMSTAIQGADLFNPNGTSKPDSMTKLMSIAASFPLGASTPVGQMMFHQLGSQIEYNMPLAGTTPQQPSGDAYSGDVIGKVTTYSPTESGADSNTRNGLSAIGKLTPLSLAVSPDIESELTKKGLKLGDAVNVHLANGQTVQRIWDDRTSSKLTGRVDFNTPDGENQHEGQQVLGITPAGAKGSQDSDSSPMDMFREPMEAIDKRIATLQSMLPPTVTRGNHVLYDNTLNQISRLQVQKDKLIEQAAVQTRADAREKLAEEKALRDEKRLDMMQQRIDAAEKRGDDATASRLRTEHRMEIKDQIEPVQKSISQLETQLRDARKSYESFSTAVVQESDPKKKNDWIKKARQSQVEMQGIQEKIAAKQEQVSSLTQRLSNLDGDSSASTKKQPTQADVSKAFSDANGDRAKAKELLKSRGYAID